MVIEQPRHALRAEVERIELAVEIAIKGPRQARVGGQDIDDVLAENPTVEELHRRDQHAFLKALGRHRIVVARHVPADIVPMPDRGQIAEQFAAVKDRLYQSEIGKMRAAIIGIVEDPQIAVMNPVLAGGLVDHRFHREGHDADEHRQARLALHQRFAGDRVVDTMRGIMRLGDDRIERRAKQRCIHLVGDLL